LPANPELTAPTRSDIINNFNPFNIYKTPSQPITPMTPTTRPILSRLKKPIRIVPSDPIQTNTETIIDDKPPPLTHTMETMTDDEPPPLSEPESILKVGGVKSSPSIGTIREHEDIGIKNLKLWIEKYGGDPDKKELNSYNDYSDYLKSLQPTQFGNEKTKPYDPKDNYQGDITRKIKTGTQNEKENYIKYLNEFGYNVDDSYTFDELKAQYNEAFDFMMDKPPKRDYNLPENNISIRKQREERKEQKEKSTDNETLKIRRQTYQRKKYEHKIVN
jgi:hypothetical protein